MLTTPVTIETIAQDHFGFLYRVVSRAGVPAADIEDVLQITLLEIARSMHSCDFSTDPRAWLGTIARRCAGRYLRQGRRQPATVYHDDVAMEEIHDPSPIGEALLLSDEELQFVKDTLAKMAPERREVFELCAFEGLSDAVVSEILNIPRETVRSRLRRAREDIQAAMRRRRAGRATIFPLGAFGHERPALEDAPDGMRERVLSRLQDEETTSVPARPSEARPWPLPKPLPKPSRIPPWLPPFLGGGAVGGVIVWLLLSHSHPFQPLVSMGAAIPSAEAVTAQSSLSPPMVASADVTARPASTGSPAAPAGTPTAKPIATCVAAKPSPCRWGAQAGLDPEETMIRAAEAARDRHDLAAAREILDHHAREYPQGRLRQQRDNILADLRR